MINRNQNIRWARENGIRVEGKIMENRDIRGIYGIFVQEECVYVGRSNNIYSRIFMAKGHIQKIRYKQHVRKLLLGIEAHKEISIKVLEEVLLIGDHKAKDAQRLNSRECYWIDYFQAKDECLEQFPEGVWNRRINK